MDRANRWDILLTQPLQPAAREILNAVADLRQEANDIALSEDDMVRLGQKSDAFISTYAEQHRVFSSRVLRASKNLKVIGWVGAGFDHIDVDVATELGIYVTYNDVQCAAVSDQTMALLLCVTRKLAPAYAAVRRGDWESKGFKLYRDFFAPEIHHKTIGIAGLGRIGAGVARRAHGFDMNIIYFDGRNNEEAERTLGARRVDFETFLSTADFICCCLPLDDNTRRIFNKSAFAQMKPSAIFVNTSRGKCVDTEDLYNALASGNIAAAALDVVDPEPIPSSHPILQLENFLIVPHLGATTVETREQQHLDVANETLRVLNGYRPHKLLNPEVLKVRPLPEEPK